MHSKYQRWYDDIIASAKSRTLDCYSERHHILPRSLGGGDAEVNLATLTYREHFLVHWLLTKIYGGDARRAMVYALWCMTLATSGRITAGWQFEIAKRAVKAESIKRGAQRRIDWLVKRKTFVHTVRDAALTAINAAPLLDPSRLENRYKLRQMANDCLRADTNRLRRRSAPWKRGKSQAILPEKR